MTATRRLAAILAIDVVGCSRLMGEDEAGTARAVPECPDTARPMNYRCGACERPLSPLKRRSRTLNLT